MPQATTQYTLTAEGPGGAVSSQFTVRVQGQGKKKKKLEVPVKKLFLGQPLEKVVSLDTLSNPRALDDFIHIAAQFSNTNGGVVSH